MAITPNEVIVELGQRVQDPDQEHWGRSDWIEYMNNALRQLIALRPESHSSIESRLLKSGTKQDLLDTDYRLIDVIRNMGSDGMTPGQIITWAHREDLDLFNRRWHQGTGKTIIDHYSYDSEKDKARFYVFPPVPATGSVYVEVNVAKHSTRITLPSIGTFTASASTDRLRVERIYDAIKRFGVNLGTFVDRTDQANSSADADWGLAPATSTVGDYTAFGSPQQFSVMRLDNANGTAGIGGIVIWEYWDGTAWSSLSGVTDDTAGFTAAVSDEQLVTWTIPTNWAKTTIDGSVPLFYVRARTTTVYTTTPIYDQGRIIEDTGLTENDRVGVTTSAGGTLPTPLSAAVNYFAVNFINNEFNLSLESGGSKVDLTDSGTGTHSLEDVSALFTALSIGDQYEVPLKEWMLREAYMKETTGGSLIRSQRHEQSFYQSLGLKAQSTKMFKEALRAGE